MSENQESATQTQATTSQDEQSTIVNNPEAVLNKNRELLAESAALKEKIRAIEAKTEAERVAKLEEDGKYKELLTEKEKELERLTTEANRAKRYDDFFGEQLKEITAKLDDKKRKLIDGYNGDNAEKLELAKSLIEEGKPGIAAARVGGSAYSTEQLDKSKYTIQQLVSMRHENPELYKKIMEG